MLKRTFIHARGIGPATERRLWEAGIRTWDELVDACEAGGPAMERARRILPTIAESQIAMRSGRIEFFARRLPRCEMWRLYPCPAGKTVFFDIETTGLVPSHDLVTVIGTYDGCRFRAFVRGEDLDEFPSFAEEVSLWISYNGASFDVPFLQALFPGFRPRAHLDLRFPLKRLGYSGGLKQIERQIGVRRPDGLSGLDGLDAIRLWREHERGSPDALRTLLAYTREDVINLEPLAELVVEKMCRRLGFGGSPATG